MNSLEVEIEIIKWLGIERNLIVTNCSWGIGLSYEADVVSLGAMYATEIEIKISKGDLLKDKNKKHTHNSNLFKHFYFAVPKKLELIALAEIPEKAGLLVVEDIDVRDGQAVLKRKQDDIQYYYRQVVMKKPPLSNKNAVKWDDRQRYQLARLGAIKVLAMKNECYKTKFVKKVEAVL